MSDYDIPTLKENIDRDTVDQVLALDVDKYKYGFVTEIEMDRAPRSFRPKRTSPNGCSNGGLKRSGAG